MLRLGAALIAIGASGVALPAHHGYDTYDQSRLMWIDGQVDHFRYAEPHATLTVKDASGRVFEGEWAKIDQLEMMNVEADSLKQGDRVIVAGNPQKDTRIQKVHVKAVHRLSDGWHWPRCGSSITTGAYDCTIPAGPYGVGQSGLVLTRHE